MPLALSVFGVAAPDSVATFCYAQVRALRTSHYPAPALPKAVTEQQELSRIRTGRNGLVLQVWDVVLSGEDSLKVEADLRQGLLRLPQRCPIQSGTTLTGRVFAETLIAETCGRIPVEGGGALQTRGFVIENAAQAVIASLQGVLKRAEIGEELNALLAMIDAESGLHGLVVSTRRLGTIEFLARRWPDADVRPVQIRIIKPELRSQDPCSEIVLTRSRAAPAMDLRIALTARSGTAVILERLSVMAASESELKVDEVDP
jgi:hypothetical protein